MKPPRAITLTLLLSSGFLLGSHASAQQLSAITEWAFDNNPVAVNTSPAPSTGTGTASSVGMGGNGTGTNYNPTQPQPTDTSDINTSTPNSSDLAGVAQWRIRGGDGTASPGAGSNAWSSNAPIGAQGAQFVVSTTGFNNIQVSFDWSPTAQGESKLQLQYTLNGSTYSNVPISLYTATGGATSMTNTTSANTVMGGYLVAPSASYFNGITVNLSSIAGANNDPTFGIRMVSAATGADDTNIAGTALNNTSGNWRFDAVTISGNAITAAPEPSTYALMFIGAAGLAVVVRRSRHAQA